MLVMWKQMCEDWVDADTESNWIDERKQRPIVRFELQKPGKNTILIERILRFTILNHNYDC